MSAPSTPRTTRSASLAVESPAILTPGKKIKAMLAAFDSDSDTENGQLNPKAMQTRPKISGHQQTAAESDDGDNSSDDDIIVPRGRMAARLQAMGQSNGTNTSSHASHTESALERVSKTLRNEKSGTEDSYYGSAVDAAETSDDDLPIAGPRKRLAGTKISTEHDVRSSRSPSRARSFSPLFMSSPRAQESKEQDQERSDDSDDDKQMPKVNSRFLALVAQKRKERELKEREEREKRKQTLFTGKSVPMTQEEIYQEDQEDVLERVPIQQSRPARKASKKALEEMNRETQRMSRNLQLAHQATTKKKISKESFLARFNFTQQQEQENGPSADNSSTTTGSQHSSDAEAQKNKGTPHTSPVIEPSEKPPDIDATSIAMDEDTEFPTLEDLIDRTQKQSEQPLIGLMEDHGANSDSKAVAPRKEKKPHGAPPVRVRLSRQAVARNQKDDSDSDLEVVTSPGKCRRLAAFENVPTKKVQESSALLKLKALAHLTSPTRRPAMNNAELSAQLLHKARQQATHERQERVQELKAKGIIIETAAERATMEDELENLVEKARKEAADIAKQEREAVKKQNGGFDDEDDDEEYDESDFEEEDCGDNEDEDENEDEDGEDGDGKEVNLFDSEAGEDEESDDDMTEAMSVDEANVTTKRRKRPTRVVSDDEDEDQQLKTPAKPINSPARFIERPHIPGLPSNDMTMSLTQAFAGTLGGSWQDYEQGSSTIPDSLPDPVQMTNDRQESDSQMIIKDSQEPQTETADLLARYTPSVARVSESPARRTMSQLSQVPDPTQDAGFVLSPFDPSKRFLGTPVSTVETVLIERDESRENTLVPERKMKHLRRGRATELSIIEEQEEGDFEVDASSFNVMKKAAKKPSVPFDRKKSKAKDVVEEAAEESEDEYAGLGGASDEDSGDEENVYDRQMINDSSGETVDEKQLAALNALHQRNADEKQVAKLLKDITTGALRRRRQGDDEFDLDDSDDELLARRREKQREFARMRKALMADEKIGEIAENPKKAAFFKAIEDREEADDVLDFLHEESVGSQEYSSSQDVKSGLQDAMAEANSKRKRPLEPGTEDTYNRPPPHMRRKPASAMSKKPTTLAEIRETVSFLTERPEYDSFHEDAAMEDEERGDRDHEDEGTDKQALASQLQEEFARRTHPRRTRGPVVDRLALLRQASSNSATSASSSTRFAFHTSFGESGSNIGFRPPPPLRKASTASSSSSTSSKSDPSWRAPKVPASGGGSLTKKGAVNYYTAARERERERELRTQNRAGGSNIAALLNRHANNRLGALSGTGQWD
ncbi:hypothetical protein EYZ11_003868 [Aspergillus tanneri]|uniref:DNA replication checkpoint mediator MRC1 domain-containing protein n=1 Tax=Aspergillus tanneri TaxID=1220188 RepID=A0A4S3JMD8_9EURO|nr:uncharacterized protein ATNIH1004_005861 [Aspergillus tanneri]KAA8647171.1 hypothetical protein ATNIH1004_005861 [Aspergillus tanneri]THC96663.1 hypothetical protein EYZ11_003868 [Aspergillus tanneri]